MSQKQKPCIAIVGAGTVESHLDSKDVNGVDSGLFSKNTVEIIQQQTDVIGQYGVHFYLLRQSLNYRHTLYLIRITFA